MPHQQKKTSKKKKAPKTDAIKKKALEILRKLSVGEVIQRKDWIDQTTEEGDFARNTVWAVVSDLIQNRDMHDIERLPKGLSEAQGVYRPRPKQAEAEILESSESPQILDEDEFYPSFARKLEDWEECSIAMPWGGAGMGIKWGTPDVIGIRKPPVRSDALNFPTEIVAVEIKSRSRQQRLIEAFGQACAYKAFAHKVYLVVPDKPHSSEDDIGRLDSLCKIFGLGLCLFDPTNKDTDFSIRARAHSHQPDISHVEFLLDKLPRGKGGIKDKLGL